jgi:hypothetical protein
MQLESISKDEPDRYLLIALIPFPAELAATIAYE